MSVTMATNTQFLEFTIVVYAVYSKQCKQDKLTIQGYSKICDTVNYFVSHHRCKGNLLNSPQMC